MPSAILAYDLDDPDDIERFRVESRGRDWYLMAWRLEQWLRDRSRDERTLESGRISYERARGKIAEIMDELGVSFEDMS